MKLQIVKRIPRLPPRQADSHKGDYGRVLVIGGSRGMIGAPALCANSALRSGAGLVRIATQAVIAREIGILAPCATLIPHQVLWSVELSPGERLSPRASKRLRLEVQKAWTKLSSAFETNDVGALGPGWSVDEGRRELLRRILRNAKKPIVLDADGLNTLAQLPNWTRHVRQYARRGNSLVLTPHPGEMQRLLESAKIRLDAVDDRRDAAARVAEVSGAIVVLKGHRTIVTDGKRLFENTTGNPGMATGGTGDVLTGIIASLIGQKLTPFDAAVLGVHVHGLAGDLAARKLGQVSMIATDLIEQLPDAFRELRRKP